MMELKPCPFCGGVPGIRDHRTAWSVQCYDCGAMVVGKRAPEPDGNEPESYWQEIMLDAITLWNRRNGEKP